MAIRLALILCLMTASAAADQVYKTVDANGNVVYTDVPPVNREGQPDGEEITVPQANTYAPPVISAPADDSVAPTAAAAYYSEVVIVDPAEDATIRENSGEVLIQVATMPGLRRDHRLLLILDGSPTEVEAEDGVFQLSNVDRGTHTAAARIVNGADETLLESEPVTFHLLRYALPTPTAEHPIVKPRAQAR